MAKKDDDKESALDKLKKKFSKDSVAGKLRDRKKDLDEKMREMGANAGTRGKRKTYQA